MKRKISPLILCLILLLPFLPGCTSYPEETRMAKDYLGMTFGEVKSLWGNDCTLGGDLYDGAKKGVCYEDGRTPYIFLFDTEITDITSLPDDAIVTLVRAEAGKGKPCDAMKNTITRNDVSALYAYDTTPMESDFWYITTFNIRQETVSVRYFYYAITDIDQENEDYWSKYYSIPSFVYEVYVTPEEYRQEQYYHDVGQERIAFYHFFGAFPPESWDGETFPPSNFSDYYFDYGKWSDPDAVREFVETGVWPEDAYAPHPYDDIQKIEFYNEFGFYPVETGWDHSWPSYNEICYWKDYGEWSDPKAVDTFLSTGHWPENAYVPFPYSDSRLLETYNRTGEWPEGTDLSALPEKTQWEE